jgi:hypothetical protein
MYNGTVFLTFSPIKQTNTTGSRDYGGENMHFFFYDSSKINPWFGF